MWTCFVSDRDNCGTDVNYYYNLLSPQDQKVSSCKLELMLGILNANIIIALKHTYFCFVTFVDAYKTARNCKGEDFCLEIPLNQVNINKHHLVIFQKYDIVATCNTNYKQCMNDVIHLT